MTPTAAEERENLRRVIELLPDSAIFQVKGYIERMLEDGTADTRDYGFFADTPDYSKMSAVEKRELYEEMRAELIEKKVDDPK
jgi:hypothetical protein